LFEHERRNNCLVLFKCLLPTSTFDEQLLITNDNYKSSESESSHSLYLSPNDSLIDIQNMVQELDEINNHSNEGKL
jgi:hypothetical protein